ncbi:PelD GGDEF domain-containing protein [Persephonella sp.]
MGKKRFRMFIESILLSSLFVLFGYIWNNNDPLFLHVEGNITYYIFVVILLTLYYGLLSGILSMFVFGLSALFLYQTFPYQTFFWYLLITFALGEFQQYYRRRIERVEEENSFLKDKIEELGRNFFTLKISHDQIEKNYVLKPLSIRSVLNDIRKMIITGENQDLFKNFLMLISRFTNIDSGSLYIKEGNKFKRVASVGKGAEFNEKDPLIEQALADNASTYVAVSRLNGEVLSDYLAVIPAVNIHGEIKGILLISEMPFLNLNKDNLLTINVFITYLFDEYSNINNMKSIIEKYPDIDVSFLKEVQKLIHLNKKFQIESSIVVFFMEKTDFLESMFIEIEKNVRGFDLSLRYSGDLKEKLIILLPFTGDLGAVEFVDRIKGQISEKFGEGNGKRLKNRILSVNKELDKIITEINEI